MGQGPEDVNRENSHLRPQESGDVKSSAMKLGLDAINDLAALLSRAALSESQYREFSPLARPGQQIQTESPAEELSAGAQKAGPGATEDPGARGFVHFRLITAQDQRDPANLTSETVPASGGDEELETSPPALSHSNGHKNFVNPIPHADSARNSRTRLDTELESRWSVLGRALSSESDDSPGRLIQVLANSVSLPFAFIAAISGGTGVTTILATLARCLAARGERVLLADHGSASLLPIYFGAIAGCLFNVAKNVIFIRESRRRLLGNLREPVARSGHRPVFRPPPLPAARVVAGSSPTSP